jgi:hypothetical protein
MIICSLSTYLRTKDLIDEGSLGMLFVLGFLEIAVELSILAYLF